MKYRCLIVDDEPIAQQILEKYICQVEVLELVGICSNAFEALNYLHQNPVDILLLDIKMPTLSGLEMLKTLHQAPKVILTTAFSEFGVESYEYGIVDYLLKPISFERFLKAVNKIILTENPAANVQQSQDGVPPLSSFIFFKADKKIHKYYFKDILFIEGSGNYVKIHAVQGPPLLVLDKLSDLVEKLPKQQFVRVHKSYIVNVSHIERIEGNSISIRGTGIPLSGTYKPGLDSILQSQ